MSKIKNGGLDQYRIETL